MDTVLNTILYELQAVSVSDLYNQDSGEKL